MLRRQFLRFLAASPMVGAAAAARACEPAVVPQAPEMAPFTYRSGSIELRADMIVIADQDGRPRVRIGHW